MKVSIDVVATEEHLDLHVAEVAPGIRLSLEVINKNASCGQSYKQFRIVIYDPRVVIWGNFMSGMTLESYITIVEAL